MKFMVALSALSLIVIACVSGATAPSVSPTALAGTPTSSVGIPASPVPAASPSVGSDAIGPQPGEPWLAFRAPRADGRDGIFLARPDGSDRHQIVADLPFVQAAPAWSPDGQKIAFVERNPGEALWIVDVDGSNAHEIVPVTSGCCGQDKPDWSPDGKTIAFMRWIGPENAIKTQVMFLDVATGTLSVAFTAKSPTQIQRARWSPDGTRLAVDVTTMKPNGVDYEGGAIGLIDLRTKALAVLTESDQFFGYPSWDATGTALVFESQGLTYWDDTPAGEATNLWTINVDGTGLKQITHNEAGADRATEPFWLTDGSICYVEAEAKRSPDRFLQCLAPDLTPLPDPASPIQGTHPRFRPVP